jgi:hypothetical protein
MSKEYALMRAKALVLVVQLLLVTTACQESTAVVPVATRSAEPTATPAGMETEAAASSQAALPTLAAATLRPETGGADGAESAEALVTEVALATEPAEPVQAPEDEVALAEAVESLASAEVPCLICAFEMATYAGPLAPEEIGGLLLALNDEYRAYAVYGQVVADFGDVRPFTSIQRSEANHIASLAQLIQAYGLAMPENPWPNQVPSYESVSAACSAGVAAEILNADLYTRLFGSTGRQDIKAVYEALQRASNENHLPAFRRCANR